MSFKCDICGKGFDNQRSLSNHRRWHDLPEYQSFQESYKKKISLLLKNREITQEWRKKISNTKKTQKLTHEKNHNWKGDKVSYTNLHVWVRKYKTQPKKCENCGEEKAYLELANISGEYKRDLNDFVYLCVKCHKEMDNTLKSFIEGGKKHRFREGSIPWNKGIPRTEETKRKISEALMRYNNQKKVSAN